MLLAATVLVAPTPAAGQPTTAAGLLTHYYDLSKEAERVNEELLIVQESLVAQQRASETAKAEADRAKAAAELAHRHANAVPNLDRMADVLTRRRGVDALSAFAVSETPDDLLARLEAAELATLLSGAGGADDGALARADEAARVAEAAEKAADRAEAKVAAGAEDVQRRRGALDTQIREVRSALDGLTPEQRSLLAGIDDFGGDVVVPSGDVGGMLEFALAQMGKPYLWGAVGPDSYDCSGLVQTAFRNAGVAMPRVSRQQAQVGQAIARTEVRAGDLIFYFQPVQHVAIAVDNQRAVHAPTFGENVKLAGIDAIGPITVIRRVIG
ncbi:C40 family peptidase [Actinophytocola sediminis]